MASCTWSSPITGTASRPLAFADLSVASRSDQGPEAGSERGIGLAAAPGFIDDRGPDHRGLPGSRVGRDLAPVKGAISTKAKNHRDTRAVIHDDHLH